MAHKPGHYGTSSNLGSQLNNFNNISWAGGADTPYNSNNYNTSYNMADSIRKEVVPGLNQNAGWLSNDWGNNWELAKGAGKDLWTGLGKGTDKLFTAGGMEGLGSVLGGFGKAAEGWAALQGLKKTEDAMNLKQDNWEEEMRVAKQSYNNKINMTNAWMKAQGRTDLLKNV
jgi:hypothetical protein